MDLNLLLILPDIDNKRILAYKTNGTYQLPLFTEPVGENTAFDETQAYNDYFQEIIGISVYRRYTFNTQNYVVFVFEQIARDNAEPMPVDKFGWVSYNDFAAACDISEVAEIANSVKLYYDVSENMPWVKHGFSPYFTWLHKVCRQKDIHITGDICQLKNAYVSTVFRVSTNIGNIYMKIPGTIFISEIPFTYGLKKLDITNLPYWMDCDFDMNVMLMKDMCGSDLSNESSAETLRDVLLSFASIQKNSIPHMPLDFFHHDSTISAFLGKLDTFPQKASEILSGTQYKLTQSELENLQSHVITAAAILQSINTIPIPNTIHHGDVRPGNIRVIDENYMFYDWAWGAVSHPFIEIVSFLHIIRRTLNEVSKDMLINTYLRQWLAYGTYDELKYVFSTLSAIKDLFFAIVDYDWVETIKLQTNNVNMMSADGWLADRRAYYLANVLRRFIETPIAMSYSKIKGEIT